MVMEVPATQRVLEAFERQSSFLRVALGTASLVARFEALLERSAGRPPEPNSEADEQLLDALLGCVALKDALAGVLSQALDVPSIDPSVSPSAPLSPPRSLLR